MKCVKTMSYKDYGDGTTSYKCVVCTGRVFTIYMAPWSQGASGHLSHKTDIARVDQDPCKLKIAFHVGIQNREIRNSIYTTRISKSLNH